MTPLQQAREALEPFAKIAQDVETAAFFHCAEYSLHIDDSHAFVAVWDDEDKPASVVTMGDLRRAKSILAAIDEALAAPTPPADQVEVVRNTVTDEMVLAAYRVAIDPATPGPALPTTAIDRPALLACTRLMLEAAIAAMQPASTRIAALEEAAKVAAFDKFASLPGAVLLAYNVLGEWKKVAAFCNLPEWPGFRERMRIELARQMLFDYLSPDDQAAAIRALKEG